MNRHTMEIDRLVVHHSASPLSTTVGDIEKWHVDERGWDAIGYHWVITRLGFLEPTRPIIYQGAHARGFNDGSLGVCLVGNNTEEANCWTELQVEALAELWLALRTAIPDLEVHGHRDLASGTECPGVDIRPMLLGPRHSERT